MAGKLITRLSETFLKFENAIISVILRKLQPGLNIANIDCQQPQSKFSIKDIWNEGFLWGVPKHRRSLEKRLSRKFGWPKYNWKPLIPKTNILMCNACGHFHEADTICGHCYDKIKQETLEIQKAVENEFKLDPVKEDIVVLYENETKLKEENFWKKQRIIEMPKKRPNWFHFNLLEPTTEKSSDSKEVKPTDLA